MVPVDKAKPSIKLGKGVVDEKGPLRISPLNAEFSSEKLVPAVTSNFIVTYKSPLKAYVKKGKSGKLNIHKAKPSAIARAAWGKGLIIIHG